MRKHKLLFLGFILVLGILLAACGAVQTEPSAVEAPSETIQAPAAVIAEGTIRPVQAVFLSFQAYGPVEALDVKLGDRVTSGQVLARLSSAAQAEVNLAAAQLALLSAQQDLDTLNRTGDANLAAAWTALMDAQKARGDAQRAWERLNLDSIADRIDDAQAEVADRESDLQDAQDKVDKYADLAEDNPTRTRAEDDLERAQKDYNEAVRDLEALQRQRDSVRAALDAAQAVEAESQYQYDISSNGPNSDQLALAQARLDSAQDQVNAAQAVLDNYLITAPFDGVVTGVNVHLGDQAGPGTWAVSIADTSAWEIQSTDITELEIVRIAVGQRVNFTADAFPEVNMTGVVTAIEQSPVMRGGDVTYVVHIEPDKADLDPRVMWGMTLELDFEPQE